MNSISNILTLSLYSALGAGSSIIFGTMTSNLCHNTDWKWYALWASIGSIASTKYGFKSINNRY